MPEWQSLLQIMHLSGFGSDVESPTTHISGQLRDEQVLRQIDCSDATQTSDTKDSFTQIIVCFQYIFSP